MPSNLKDYMQKQSRQSSMMQQEQPNEGYRPVGKFTMSRNECIDELTNRLNQLLRRQQDLKLYSQNGTSESLRKFEEDFSVLQKQIIRNVEAQLRQTKQKMMRQIRERRNIEMTDIKPIRKNIERLRHQLTGLREGLHRDHEYREYIARVVKKDFENQLQTVRVDIKKLRYPNVHLSINEQHYSCFKNDLDRLIVTDDELLREGLEFNNRPPRMSGTKDSTLLNMHQNRDHIKRNNMDEYR